MNSLYDHMLAAADPAQVPGLSRFFKTGPGQYGEGDKFLGIKVPVTRAIVKQCWQDTLPDNWQDVGFPELERCIGIVSTMTFVRHGQLQDTFNIADILLHHPHDLIQKAVGWLLREAGKRDLAALEAFLLPRYPQMPRTMLRYAIEKFPKPRRQEYLSGTA